MTTALVLRLGKKRAELLKKEAHHRGASRKAVVLQALDNLLGKPISRGKTKTDRKLGKAKLPAKGVGWAEHFAWLEKHGRRVDSNIADEIREMDRNRGFR